MLARLSPDVRQYLLITGNYWAFTLTDGALRMLVVLHFHQLGYSPLHDHKRLPGRFHARLTGADGSLLG